MAYSGAVDVLRLWLEAQTFRSNCGHGLDMSLIMWLIMSERLLRSYLDATTYSFPIN